MFCQWVEELAWKAVEGLMVEGVVGEVQIVPVFSW